MQCENYSMLFNAKFTSQDCKVCLPFIFFSFWTNGHLLSARNSVLHHYIWPVYRHHLRACWCLADGQKISRGLITGRVGDSSGSHATSWTENVSKVLQMSNRCVFILKLKWKEIILLLTLLFLTSSWLFFFFFFI